MEEKSRNILKIPGTKPSFHNAQLLVSSGIPSLDTLLGDGIPVGTVSLIEEDVQGTYARIILKYFLAEGVINEHSVLIASQEINPKNIINQLPAVTNFDPEPINKVQNDERMKIAFRYHNLPTTEIDLTHQFGHYYDLSKTMPVDMIDRSDVHYWNGEIPQTASSMFKNPAYHDLLQTIKMKIKTGNFLLNDPSKQKSILRIGIHGLGSPMWLSDVNTVNKDLNTFMYCLRALVRSAFVVAVVTIPRHLFQESIDRCVHSSDIVIRLQAFAGTELEHNKYLSEYHGYFHIDKLAAVNSFVSKHPGSVEYMFKLRRKKFCIEKLHLPPDLEVSKDDKFNNASVSCGSSDKHLLEF